MKKYFNRITISILLIFILQSLNVAFCLTHPDVGKFATYFAIVADCFIFGSFIISLMNSK